MVFNLTFVLLWSYCRKYRGGKAPWVKTDYPKKDGNDDSKSNNECKSKIITAKLVTAEIITAGIVTAEIETSEIMTAEIMTAAKLLKSGLKQTQNQKNNQLKNHHSRINLIWAVLTFILKRN